jgi:hypothetical protein
MGFWPFGKKGEDVEVATRIVSAASRDQVTVRGKLSLHFATRQSKAAADVVADQLASLVEAILREAPDRSHIVGKEAEVLAELEARLPSNMPPTRTIEIAALHAVGDYSRPSGEFAPVSAPGSRQPPSSGRLERPSSPKPSSAVGPPQSAPASPVSTPRPAPKPAPQEDDALEFSLDSIPLDTRRRPLQATTDGTPIDGSQLELHPNSSRSLELDEPEVEARTSPPAPSNWPPPPPSLSTPKARDLELGPASSRGAPSTPRPAERSSRGGLLPVDREPSSRPAQGPSRGSLFPADREPSWRPVERPSSGGPASSGAASSRASGFGLRPDSAPPLRPPSERPRALTPMPPAVQNRVRRASSHRIHAITAGMIPPVGSSPQVIGIAIASVLRDAAGRLFVGALRAYDLVNVRGIRVDDGASGDLTGLVPTSDAPPGGFEASRFAEIAKWKAALGADGVDHVRAECGVCSTYLSYATMLDADVPQNITFDVLQAATSEAFPRARSPLGAIGRYMHPAEPSLAEELAAQLRGLLDTPVDVGTTGQALGPLMTSVEEDLRLAASLVKEACGL